MAIWNKSLSNYSSFTIIFSMLCIKIVSKQLIYHYLTRALKEITPKYLEDYANKPDDTNTIAKKMKSDWSLQFPIWWKEDHSQKTIKLMWKIRQYIFFDSQHCVNSKKIFTDTPAAAPVSVTRP